MDTSMITGTTGAPNTAEVRGPGAEAADILYGKTTKPTAPTPSADASLAERLYPPGKPGANGSTLYGKSEAGINIKVNAAEAAAVALNPAGTTPALKTQAAELSSTFASVGLDRHDVQNITDFANANALKPPTEEEARANQLTSLRELREQYGPNFDAAFQAAKDLVQSSPQLNKFLDKAKLGNHPTIVLRMAELGLLAKARGKLK